MMMSNWVEMFKHGVADGLLHGTRDDNKHNFYYKQGYDYGITLYGRVLDSLMMRLELESLE